MTESTKKVIAEVPETLRNEIDDLALKLDLRMSQMIREALERTVPLWRHRAVERSEAAEATI